MTADEFLPVVEPPAVADRLDEAAAAFLVGLPGATRQRIGGLLSRWSPADAVRAVAGGDPAVLTAMEHCRDVDALRRTWSPLCAAANLAREEQTLRSARVGVWWVGQPGWADAFAQDPEPPAVLFHRGALLTLGLPRVSIVGTRNATSQGREMAKLLGRQLSDSGVAVVSGLALGIDAAAHHGAIASGRSGPIGVVGSGLDVVYPRQNARLWSEVAELGVLLSESAPGRGPTPQTFPERNRIIAQLGTVLVVVESHAKGGSLITVDRAIERSRRVLAVPGSPLSLASAGSNALLRGSHVDRAAVPCLGAEDVLALLDLDRVTAPTYVDPRPQPSAEGCGLLALLGWESWPLGRLVPRSGLGVADVTLALAELEAEGWVGRSPGGWHRLATRPW